MIKCDLCPFSGLVALGVDRADKPLPVRYREGFFLAHPEQSVTPMPERNVAALLRGVRFLDLRTDGTPAFPRCTPRKGRCQKDGLMPTKQPRVNVTITDHQHALLMELGSLQGRSASSFLREMLDAATPMLDATLPIYRAAAEQAQMQPEALQSAITTVLGQLDEKSDQLDLLRLLSTIVPTVANDGEGEAERTAASGASEDALPPTTPPSSNTGVSSERVGNKSVGKGRSHG